MDLANRHYDYLSSYLTTKLSDSTHKPTESDLAAIGEIIAYYLGAADPDEDTETLDPKIMRAALATLPRSAEVEVHNPERRQVPVNRGRVHGDLVNTPWRLSLLTDDPHHRPLFLEIRGDIFFGRTTNKMELDVDLTAYNAAQMGVSRQHALICATPTELRVADLGSVNGTFWNGTRLNPGEQRAVTTHGVLTLGALHFLLRIDQRPAGY